MLSNGVQDFQQALLNCVTVVKQVHQEIVRLIFESVSEQNDYFFAFKGKRSMDVPNSFPKVKKSFGFLREGSFSEKLTGNLIPGKEVSLHLEPDLLCNR